MERRHFMMTLSEMKWNGMKWNGMEWNGIFSNKYVNTNMDCNEYCRSILDEQHAILVKINDLEKGQSQGYSQEAIAIYNKLDEQRDRLQGQHRLCMMDCENRNRTRLNDQRPITPPLQALIDELNELTDEEHADDENADSGGNKRRRRVPRCRRSLRDRTHRQQPRQPRQTRRNQRRSTRRRNGRHHRTRRHRK
ncbi:MAG: hypothetical protein FJX80_01140 [Bacteroidetes bacterium]|nr:hypothetical protein [Bacteroidota bacterium]